MKNNWNKWFYITITNDYKQLQTNRNDSNIKWYKQLKILNNYKQLEQYKVKINYK
jgi:hypothetical protein